jgi:hypothetical protein
MAWKSLPHDIRFLILRTLCADIISEFKKLSSSFWDIAIENGYFIIDKEVQYVPSLEWPSIPSSLTSFMSTIKTCREFHDIVLHRIKFDGDSPAQVLKTRQAETISDISNRLHYEASRHNPENGNNYKVVDVALFYEAAGPFWRNPLVVAAEHYILYHVLHWSAPSAYPRLLPHLGRWLNIHRPESSECRRYQYHLTTCKPDDHSSFRPTVQPRCPPWHGISKVVRVPYSWSCRPSLMEQDLRAHRQGQWWLFSRGPLRWVLINYREERMYIAPDVSKALSWKGKDPFLNSWDELTTMEAIENLGRN